MAKRGTRLIHPETRAPGGFESLAVPTYRGSTVLFDKIGDVGPGRYPKDHYRYGLSGTPTTRELALRISALEGAKQTLIVPSGQAAIALTYLALCKGGDHVLLPASAYGPNHELANGPLAAFGIEAEAYEPGIGGGIAAQLRPETRLVWCESPGSITMEVQDVPAIAAAAHAAGALVAVDNTYAAGILFDAFGAGADISIQALTKYVGGHSDLLLGSVSSRDAGLGRRLASAQRLFGQAVSPDDCSLALRGLQTLEVRLKAIERSALEVARWLGERPEVTALLHPAFPDCPGHALWQRDFGGSASIFSVIFGQWTRAQVEAFVDALALFGIGYSWGGVASLVLAYADLDRPTPELGPLLVRFNIGLEDPADLIADLDQALELANTQSSR